MKTRFLKCLALAAGLGGGLLHPGQAAQQAYLKPSNTGAGDNFGSAIAVAGDTLVVGAGLEDSSATGVNGNGNNNDAPEAGAAYVFVRSVAGTWTQQAYLKASSLEAHDNFGRWSVGVSGDTVVVGADGAEAAYVFVRSGTIWTQQACLKSGAPGVNLFGHTVAVSGNTIVVGAMYADNISGAAYVFVRTGTNWTSQAYLKASNAGADDRFSWSLAMSGDTVVVGAVQEASNATGVNGDQNNNGAPFSGAAYVFVRSGTNWSQQAYLKASNAEGGDQFGHAVAVAGDTVAVGANREASNATGINGNQSDNSAPNSGAAYVFVRSGTNWTQQAFLKAHNAEPSDRFGHAVAAAGDTVVVGAVEEAGNATGVNGDGSNNSAPYSGAAYVFARSGSTWTQRSYLKASNTGSDDVFGYSVAVAGDTVVVGALYEASNAAGVNGNQTNNSAFGAGAAYAFIVVPTLPLSLLCVTNKTVECAGPSPDAPCPWDFDPPTITGACSGTNVTLTVFSTVTNGLCPMIVTRTWQATNTCGSSATCSQTVTVVSAAPVAIFRQPASQTVPDCSSATFSVGAGGSAPFTYVWCANGQPIPGANGPAYTRNPVTLADNGTVFVVKISNACGRVTSAPAVLNVSADVNPPALVSATANCASNKVTVTFSERLESTSAEDEFFYEISGGVAIQSAMLAADGQTVCLLTTPLAAGTSYTVTVNGVLDLCGNAIVPDSQVSFSCSPPPPIHVFINEWLADNVNGIVDPADGQHDDWFEIYNPGPDPANLDGYFLTDHLSNRMQFAIPPGRSIPPGGFLLVWADGQPQQNAINAPDLHVNFTLAGGGEEIGLFAADGTAIEAIRFGAQTPDVSEGRWPDGETSRYFMPQTTPGMDNVPPVGTPAPCSSKGTRFWLAFPGNYSGVVGPSVLIAACPGPSVTLGNVSIPGLGFTANFNIPAAGGMATVALPAAAHIMSCNLVENKGVLVTANNPVSVYGFNQELLTTDGYLGLPVGGLGTDYIVLNYIGINQPPVDVLPSQFAIVASQNGTTVTITPSSTAVTICGPPASPTYSVLLNAGETYQLQGHTDLTGTKVTANLPVAVFAGNQCANVPATTAYCDHLVEQLLPVPTWGKQFFTRPLATRLNGDTIRILAAVSGTTVSLNGATVATLNSGQFYEQVVTGPACIIASSPVQVAQYAHGARWDGLGNTDPFMMLVPATKQFVKSYCLTTPTTPFLSYFTHYLNIIVPAADVGFMFLDNVSIPAIAFTPIWASGFLGATVPITPGFHRVTTTGPSPFGVNVYGWSNGYEWYGYPADLCLETNRPCEITLSCHDFATNICVTNVAVNYPWPAATSTCPPVSVVCTPPTVPSFPPGLTPINCTATDAGGATATCSFNVTVTYRLAVTNESVTPVSNVPGKLNYSFDLKNNTGVPVKYVFLVPKTNCFTFMPGVFILNPALPPGQAAQLSTMIQLSGNCPAKLCFTVSAHDSNVVECCAIMHCVTNPLRPTNGCDDVTVLDLFSGRDVFGLLPDGTFDPQFITAGTPFFTTANPYVMDAISQNPLWLAGGPNSQWIGPVPSGVTFVAGGVYASTNRFFLCSTNQAVVTGRWTADDAATIKLNGNATGVSITAPSAFHTWWPVNLTSGFVPGWNTLTFLVTNSPGFNSPTGLRTELTGTACCLDCLKIECPTNIVRLTCGTVAHVVYPPPTVTSTCGTTPVVTCVPSSAVFPIGVTTVQCTATDAQGNAATCSFTVTVLGHPPLVMTCPPNQILNTCSAPFVANYNVTTSGGVPPVTVTCTPPSGTALPYGVRVVNCTATDVCGETVSCSFTVTVQQPVDPPCIPIGIALDSTNLTISWPAEATNVELEATDSLNPPIVWLPVEAEVHEMNGRSYVTLPVDSSMPMQFFHLKLSPLLAPPSPGWSACTTWPLTARYEHSAVWTGSEMILWGGFDGSTYFNDGARYDPVANTWTLVPTTSITGPAPVVRYRHTAVWTGKEMIVWGGNNGIPSNIGALNTGGRYDPGANTWTATSLSGAPDPRSYHTAVWTGSKMIIWGGDNNNNDFLDTGGRYDPANDMWMATTTLGAPLDRTYHTAVWTGSEMIIWGGLKSKPSTSPAGDGGRYDPATDKWAPAGAFSLSGAPVPRYVHTAVWTGYEMIVWGGAGASLNQNTGGRYNPAANTWTATTLNNAPAPRHLHTAVMACGEMIVWGGGLGGAGFKTGGCYNPATDTWTALPTLGAPPGRYFHRAVWTGSQMIVTGGRTPPPGNPGSFVVFNDVWCYTKCPMPVANWATCNTSMPLPGRYEHTAVWTGSEMILWGGFDGSTYFQDGARYDPIGNTWTPVPINVFTPVGRYRHTAVWTGKEMIVWGGNNGIPNNIGALKTGGRYDPGANTWTATSLSGAPDPRSYHTAVWTGSKMIIWGGDNNNNDFLDTGGRYDPANDMWMATTTLGAPLDRTYHTAVWTGSEMIIWGGLKSKPSTSPAGDGGRYDPATDKWAPAGALSLSGAPVPRYVHTAVWTGYEMIVWGGAGTSLNQNTGGRYNPAANTWTATTLNNAPAPRHLHTAVMACDDMIVWGGGLGGTGFNSGGCYNPATDMWTALPTLGGPAGRYFHRVVWTGRRMILTGGRTPPPGNPGGFVVFGDIWCLGKCP